VTEALFLATVFLVPLTLGLPVAVQPSLYLLSLTSRGALAWATGCLFLTMFLTLLSAVGIPWTPGLVALACIAALAAAARLIRKTHAPLQLTARAVRSNTVHGPLCFSLIAGIGLFLFVFGFATSADLSYFWGVKSTYFALAKGIDFELLRQPYMIHLHPSYPPLWPVLLGYGAMVVGSLPWLAVPPLTWFCLTVAAIIVFSVLEARLGARAATVVTCLWYTVMLAMTVSSFSGGNADGYLTVCVSIALVVILTETKGEPPRLRWLAALFLAAAVFTKSEGIVASFMIVVGTVVRDALWRRRELLRRTILLTTPAATSAVFWLVVRMAHDVRLTDPIRETAFHITFDHFGLIVQVCARLLVTGVVTVGWLVPLIAALLVAPQRMDRAIPAIITALGILGFAIAYYLHVDSNPQQVIVWTFPRLMQPAISGWILGAGVVVFPIADMGQPEATMAEKSRR